MLFIIKQKIYISLEIYECRKIVSPHFCPLNSHPEHMGVNADTTMNINLNAEQQSFLFGNRPHSCCDQNGFLFITCEWAIKTIMRRF